jgi:hypothetical protein
VTSFPVSDVIEHLSHVIRVNNEKKFLNYSEMVRDGGKVSTNSYRKLGLGFQKKSFSPIGGVSVVADSTLPEHKE